MKTKLTLFKSTIAACMCLVLPNLTFATNVYDDIIVPSANHTILEEAIAQANLETALRTSPSLTVFAPTDDAFNAYFLEAGVSEISFYSNPNLSNILLYHVLGQEVISTGLENAKFSTTLEGDSVFVSIYNTDVFINQAQVTTANETADNGVVHIIDDVILSGNSIIDVAVTNNFNILTQAVVKAELVPALIDPMSDLTVFAPTDAAFTSYLAEEDISESAFLASQNLDQILLYHVLNQEVLSTDLENGTYATAMSGDSVFVSVLSSGAYIDQAMVTTANVDADNGVVHVMDDVILSKNSIIDVAVTNGFNILTQAVIAAELVPALIDPMSKLTVFAPTDAAFNDLLSEMGITASDLLNDPNLSSILLYHVLDGEVLSNSLSNGDVLTLNNESVSISVGMSVMVNESNVTLTDVMADNGVVHVIDAVLLPQSLGTNETKDLNISVFPNPASNFLSIANINSKIDIITIYDLTGKIVFNSNVTSSNFNLDLNKFEPGTYIINFQGEQIFENKQFIKK